ncbi:MAG: DUF1501 domain-containing protein [Bryobacter sp.]|nr:DUF1501 domain-containing protein [Bryobacter sp.]
MKNRFGHDFSNVPGTQFWRRPTLHRRMFFRHAASARAATPISKAKYCIFVRMGGGPSHVDTFDLKEGAWLPATYNPTPYNGVLFPQGLFPKIAENLNSVALARSVKPWVVVHEIGSNWQQIGRNPLSGLSRIAPHIGSVVSIELTDPNATLPAFLSLNTGTGPGNGYFEARHAPFYVSPGGGGLANTRHPDGQPAYERRYNLLSEVDAEMRGSSELGDLAAQMASFNLSARKLMYNPNVDKVFTFDAAERLRYGNTGFGNACITARNLVRSELGTRFVQITFGGWDNHTGIYTGPLNPTNANSVGRQFDTAFGTLLADLKNDGKLDETLVIAFGEFGRTVGALNSGGGRDHYPLMSVLFAGAGIRGPKAIGATDAIGKEIVDPGWSRGREIYFEDIEATIYSALGIDWTKIRRDDPLGRGFEYVPFAASQDLYGPVHELWG